MAPTKEQRAEWGRRGWEALKASGNRKGFETGSEKAKEAGRKGGKVSRGGRRRFLPAKEEQNG